MAKVEPDLNSGCWLFSGSVCQRGYGRIGVGHVPRLVHRVVYAEVVGPIPDGMEVCHRCDTPACVNPAHLFLGTHAENLGDMKLKGRAARGEKSGTGRLSESDVLEIRRLISDGADRGEVADAFEISCGHVRQIVTRIRWAHV